MSPKASSETLQPCHRSESECEDKAAKSQEEMRPFLCSLLRVRPGRSIETSPLEARVGGLPKIHWLLRVLTGLRKAEEA